MQIIWYYRRHRFRQRKYGGKSFFGLLGIPVYSADDAAKEIMVKDPLLIQQIRGNLRPGGLRFPDGALNKFLSISYFPIKKPASEQLNTSSTRPLSAIQKPGPPASRLLTSRAAADNFEAISFHYGQSDWVYAPQTLRIRRVMERDGVNRNAVLARMHKQLDEQIKMKLADYIIYNDEQQMGDECLRYIGSFPPEHKKGRPVQAAC